MNAVRRLIGITALLTALALVADVYGPLRAAVALTAAALLLLAVSCLALARHQEPRS